MLHTPLSELRRSAPRPLTHAKVQAFFAKHGLVRKIGIFGAFERGQIKNPPARFVELWAKAVGSDINAVTMALRKTQRQRENSTGPFAPAPSFRRAAA